MRSKTSAAAHVGRIGALAVALGVGAAVTLGQGIAAADTTGSAASSSSESGSSGSTSGSASESSNTDSSSTTDQDTTESDDDSADDDTPADDAAADDESADDEPADGEPDDTIVDAGETDVVEPPSSEDQTEPTQAPTRSNDRDDTELTDTADENTDVDVDVDIDTDIGTAAGRPAAVTTPAATDADAHPAALPRDEAPGPAPLTSITPALTTVVVPAARTLPVTPPALPKTFAGLLAAVGLAPLIANLPAAPAPPPTLWALLAWARREFERAITRPVTTGSAQSSVVATAAAATPFPTTLPSVNKGWVTGKVPNNFGIGGTDLGIMWDGGIRLGERFVHVAFGDTFKNANMTGDWRSNVLLISTDHNLTNGLQLVQTGYAGRFIGPFKGRLGLFGSEVTQIPTAGIQIDGRQFVNFMSVKSWDTPGRWTTNYSAVSVYDPATDKWVLAPSTIRSAGWFRSTTRYVPGNQNFQQAAYVLQPEDQVGEDGIRYLYAFGTPSGRAGSAYLSRVAEDSVTDLSKYEYWNGDRWVAGKPAAAAPIIGDSKRSAGLFGAVIDWANDPNVFGGYLGGLFGAKTGGNVSELSVQYNEYLGKYVVLYGDGNNDIRLRTADTPEGPWSAPVTIATSKQYPGLYAPMIHPWSGTGDLKDSNGDPDLTNLYWNMSLWGDYNVVLMQTDLSPLKAVYV